SWQSRLLGIRVNELSQAPPAGRNAERTLRLGGDPAVHTTVVFPAPSMPSCGKEALVAAGETLTGGVHAARAEGVAASSAAATAKSAAVPGRTRCSSTLSLDRVPGAP
ncbi:MAG: hypothetical protein H0V81_13420, partial [Solirubrobacterales bacterium]|nr:hypothetical protein [Solirubrobacterales bacterium]